MSAGLQNTERAALDAYWTPDACAEACVAWLGRQGLLGRTAIEPSVGGGAWARALRRVEPKTAVTGVDLDPDAPGLPDCDAGRLVGDYLTTELPRADLVIGNRPYSLPLQEWVSESLREAPVVAYLERSTVLGSSGRAAWWEAHRPAYVVTLVQRVLWEGPGARRSPDTVDSCLIVWVRGEEDTRHRWLSWR